MELGMARRRTLSKEEYQWLHVENAYFYSANRMSGMLQRIAHKRKTAGKRGQSLTFTVNSTEARDVDGVEDAGQREPEQTG